MLCVNSLACNGLLLKSVFSAMSSGLRDADLNSSTRPPPLSSLIGGAMATPLSRKLLVRLGVRGDSSPRRLELTNISLLSLRAGLCGMPALLPPHLVGMGVT